MSFELEGKIIQKLPVQSGESARGKWSKQSFVVEYQDGNFPAQVCLYVWGEDKVAELGKFSDGDKVKVSFRPNCREYNGKWYTDLSAWRIEPSDGGQGSSRQHGGGYQQGGGSRYGGGNARPSGNQTPASGGYPAAPAPSIADIPAGPGDDDDLPF